MKKFAPVISKFSDLFFDGSECDGDMEPPKKTGAGRGRGAGGRGGGTAGAA